MSAATDIQTAIKGILALEGILPVVDDAQIIPVVGRRPKEVGSELDATEALHKGLAVFVHPALLVSADEGIPTPVVKYECRIEIDEIPNLNSFGVDVYQMIEAVALGLHWQPNKAVMALVAAEIAANPGMTQEQALVAVQAEEANAPLFALAALLAHPLYMRGRVTEIEQGQIEGGQFDRQIVRRGDVIFIATMHLEET